MEGAMSSAPKSGPKNPTKVTRAQERTLRLKAALKANMAKRKAQVRLRTAEDEVSATGPDSDKE